LYGGGFARAMRGPDRVERAVPFRAWVREPC